MNPNREEALFELALEKTVEKRAAFLDTICEGYPVLRQRLEVLRAAHEKPRGDNRPSPDTASSGFVFASRLYASALDGCGSTVISV